MNEIIQKQVEDTSSVIRKLVEDINFSAPENILTVNAAKRNVLNDFGDILENRKQELIDEMRRIVLEYSAKIEATNHMLRTIGREVGRREALIERIEEGETT